MAFSRKRAFDIEPWTLDIRRRTFDFSRNPIATARGVVRTLDLGRWTLDFGGWTLDAPSTHRDLRRGPRSARGVIRALDLGRWTLDIRRRRTLTLDIGRRTLDIGRWTLDLRLDLASLDFHRRLKLRFVYFSIMDKHLPEVLARIIGARADYDSILKIDSFDNFCVAEF